MKKKDFFDQVDRRLEENKKLQEKKGLGKYLGPVSDVVNEHLFWVLLGVSGLIAFWWMSSRWMNVGSAFLYGWLF